MIGSSPSGDQETKVSMTTGGPDAARSVNGTKMESLRSLKRAMREEDVYFLDASKEGNVSRFINVRDEKLKMIY